MFSIEFLHEIRTAELAAAASFIAPGSRVLEIGGGTGFQSRLLRQMGHSVECIDLPGSSYQQHRVFPVRDYDGATIPFADRAFDAVFSSNVLEHVADLPRLAAEMRRVLQPGGRCVHILPTPAWRLWSIATHYPNLPLLFLFWSTHRGQNPFPGTARRGLPRLLGRALWPGRHGENGTMLSEIYLFSRRRWRAAFAKLGFRPIAIRPTGLYYTGSMLLGPQLPLSARRRLAGWAGSATTIYVLEAAAGE
jgi:SAM-dependent methyltransferase